MTGAQSYCFSTACQGLRAGDNSEKLRVNRQSLDVSYSVEPQDTSLPQPVTRNHILAARAGAQIHRFQVFDVVHAASTSPGNSKRVAAKDGKFVTAIDVARDWNVLLTHRLCGP